MALAEVSNRNSHPNQQAGNAVIGLRQNGSGLRHFRPARSGGSVKARNAPASVSQWPTALRSGFVPVVSSHVEEQYTLRSALRHSQEEAQRYTDRLSNLRLDLAVRQDTSGDKFRIELEGQTLNNRGVAGELILRRAAKIRNNFGASPRIGKFAGFELFLHATYSGEVELSLHGKNHYSARVTDTALGTIRSLEAIVQGFGDRAVSMEREAGELQKKAKELESKVGVPFEHEKRYHELTERQAEIEEKLDLTKNQASSQIEDVSEDENDEEISPKQSQTKSNRQTRQTAVRV